MNNDNIDLFELLKANERRRATIVELLNRIKTDMPTLCFAARPLREGDYWETIDQKRTRTGYVPMIDLPLDLGLKEDVLSRLEAEHERLLQEFNSYTIKK